MLIFRSEEHVDRWLEARDLPRGALLTPRVAWLLAKEWYKDKLHAQWRRHTLEETEELFRTLQLNGEFWTLR